LRTMRRSKYPTDLSDTEWECLKAHLPAHQKGSRGRPRLHSPRQILDAGFYVLKSGWPRRVLSRGVAPPGGGRQAAPSPADARRGVLCAQERLPLAAFAPRLPTPENGLPLV